MDKSECLYMYDSDDILRKYHQAEWCKINHDDRFQFEMLSLEGASVGLSWKIIMHKRESYKKAFHNFDIELCSKMTDEELSALLDNTNLIRNKNKIFSIRENACVVKIIQKEFGSFDKYLWNFSDNKQIIGNWKTMDEIPTVSDLSIKLSKDMKKRGIKFMGPTITYSFLQAIGIVNDHLIDCKFK